MNKKTYKNWKSLTGKMLENSWKFRNLCGRPFDRGFIGELLVIKQLLKTYETDICSLPENNLIYAGSSNKEWDIELMLNGKSIFLMPRLQRKYTIINQDGCDKEQKFFAM